MTDPSYFAYQPHPHQASASISSPFAASGGGGIPIGGGAPSNPVSPRTPGSSISGSYQTPFTSPRVPLSFGSPPLPNGIATSPPPTLSAILARKPSLGQSTSSNPNNTPNSATNSNSNASSTRSAAIARLKRAASQRELKDANRGGFSRPTSPTGPATAGIGIGIGGGSENGTAFPFPPPSSLSSQHGQPQQPETASKMENYKPFSSFSEAGAVDDDSPTNTTTTTTPVATSSGPILAPQPRNEHLLDSTVLGRSPSSRGTSSPSPERSRDRPALNLTGRLHPGHSHSFRSNSVSPEPGFHPSGTLSPPMAGSATSSRPNSPLSRSPSAVARQMAMAKLMGEAPSPPQPPKGLEGAVALWQMNLRNKNKRGGTGWGRGDSDDEGNTEEVEGEVEHGESGQKDGLEAEGEVGEMTMEDYGENETLEILKSPDPTQKFEDQGTPDDGNVTPGASPSSAVPTDSQRPSLDSPSSYYNLDSPLASYKPSVGPFSSNEDSESVYTGESSSFSPSISRRPSEREEARSNLMRKLSRGRLAQGHGRNQSEGSNNARSPSLFSAGLPGSPTLQGSGPPLPISTADPTPSPSNNPTLPSSPTISPTKSPNRESPFLIQPPLSAQSGEDSETEEARRLRQKNELDAWHQEVRREQEQKRYQQRMQRDFAFEAPLSEPGYEGNDNESSRTSFDSNGSQQAFQRTGRMQPPILARVSASTTASVPFSNLASPSQSDSLHPQQQQQHDSGLSGWTIEAESPSLREGPSNRSSVMSSTDSSALRARTPGDRDSLVSRTTGTQGDPFEFDRMTPFTLSTLRSLSPTSTRDHEGSSTSNTRMSNIPDFRHRREGSSESERASPSGIPIMLDEGSQSTHDIQRSPQKDTGSSMTTSTAAFSGYQSFPASISSLSVGGGATDSIQQGNGRSDDERESPVFQRDVRGLGLDMRNTRHEGDVHEEEHDYFPTVTTNGEDRNMDFGPLQPLRSHSGSDTGEDTIRPHSRRTPSRDITPVPSPFATAHQIPAPGPLSSTSSLDRASSLNRGFVLGKRTNKFQQQRSHAPGTVHEEISYDELSESEREVIAEVPIRSLEVRKQHGKTSSADTFTSRSATTESADIFGAGPSSSSLSLGTNPSSAGISDLSNQHQRSGSKSPRGPPPSTSGRYLLPTRSDPQLKRQKSLPEKRRWLGGKKLFSSVSLRVGSPSPQLARSNSDAGHVVQPRRSPLNSETQQSHPTGRSSPASKVAEFLKIKNRGVPQSSRTPSPQEIIIKSPTPSGRRNDIFNRLDNFLDGSKSDALDQRSVIDDPPRKLVVHGPISQILRPDYKEERYMFVFNDLIMVAKPMGGIARPTLDSSFQVKSIFEAKRLDLLTARDAPVEDTPPSWRSHSMFRQFVSDFQRHPVKAVGFFIGRGGIEDSPEAAADLLFEASELDRAQLGQFLSIPQEEATLRAFLDRLVLAGRGVTFSVRVLLAELCLPSDLSAIQYLLQVFGEEWCSANPNANLSPEAVSQVSLCTIQLNDTLHNGETPGLFAGSGGNQHSIAAADFINGCRAYEPLDVLSDEFLGRIYTMVRSERLDLAATGTGGLGSSTQQRTKKISLSQFPSRLFEKDWSGPISVTIPEPDQDLILHLHGNDLEFDPPLLQFHRDPNHHYNHRHKLSNSSSSSSPSHSAMFRYRARSHGNKRAILTLLGSNANLYHGLPKSKPVRIERRFMAHTIQWAHTSAFGNKRKYLFGFPEEETKSMFFETIRNSIEDSIAEESSPSSSKANLAAQGIAFQVLRDALIGVDALPTSPGFGGGSAHGHSRSLSQGNSTLSRSRSGRGHNRQQSSNTKPPNSSSSSAAGGVMATTGGGNGKDINNNPGGGGDVRTGHDIVLTTVQNSLLPELLERLNQTGSQASSS